jgi:phosphatidate cytidylyltransferase
LLVLVPAWPALARLHAAGPQLLLFLTPLVVAADVGAYFAGRASVATSLRAGRPGKIWKGYWRFRRCR